MVGFKKWMGGQTDFKSEKQAEEKKAQSCF